MHFIRIVSAGLFFLGSAQADGAAIVAALKTVDANTLDLYNVVSRWDGGILGALPVVPTSLNLLHNTKEATETADESENLNTLEAITIAGTIQSLIKDVNSTVSALVQAKPQFDHLLTTPIVLLSLRLQKDASASLSGAIAKKLPSALVPTADKLAAQIDEAFAYGIDQFC